MPAISVGTLHLPVSGNLMPKMLWKRLPELPGAACVLMTLGDVPGVTANLLRMF